MISKKLLSEILKVNVIEVYLHKKQGWKYKTYKENTNGWTSSSDVPMPNIYELAHKCKDWALKQGFILESKLTPLEGYTNNFYAITWIISLKTGTICKKQADIEPYSVFKACQWILENKDK